MPTCCVDNRPTRAEASSARSATKIGAVAIVRASQDGEKQIGAAVARLNNLLSQPPSERDDKALADTQQEITRLQATHAQILKDLAKKFPDYGNLVNPAPPSPADLQKQLTAMRPCFPFTSAGSTALCGFCKRTNLSVRATGHDARRYQCQG